MITVLGFGFRPSSALTAGVKAAWVVGDSAYLNSSQLWQELEQAHVLAVPGHEIVCGSGPPGAGAGPHGGAAGRGMAAAGRGAKGHRVNDWQCHPLAPQGCALQTLVQVAGTRWCIASGFEAAQGEVGLDEYEGRSATDWYRHVTLVQWGMALLAVIRPITRPTASLPNNGYRQPAGFQTVPRAGVGLSYAAMRQVLWLLWLRIIPAPPHCLAWMLWQRRHQWVALCCHCRRRLRKLSVQL